ncbi:Calx-beta domain-containing protein, partial [Roseivirga sp.]|uniref:Calx-beta domain-containing protein n=1 Tax=Roseivirga sp. TaxID=1964215 RepID=UPI003B8E3F3E
GDATNNILWLRADELIGLTNGIDLSNWPDNSGNTNALSPPAAQYSPTYIQNGVNGFPIVRFTDTENDRLYRSALTRSSGVWNDSEFSLIYVNKTTDSNDRLFKYVHPDYTYAHYTIEHSNDLTVNRTTMDYNLNQSLNDGAFHIAGIGGSLIGAGGPTGQMEYWVDGAVNYIQNSYQDPPDGQSESPSLIYYGGSFTMAGLSSGFSAATSHAGDFAEVIVFDDELNSAEQIIIHNYLAAKYNIPIANDYYAHESTHKYHVIGVGRETSNDLHTESVSESGLGIASGSGLNANGEYFLLGSDNGDYSTWTTTETANGDPNTQRLAREWRVSETGELGSIEYKLDLGQMPALPSGYSQIVLMVDSDGDFSSGAKVYEANSNLGETVYSYFLDVDDDDYLAVGIINPTINITTLNTVNNESTDISLEITINYIPSNDVIVNISTESISAIAGQDFEEIDETVVIPAGTTSITYVISIIQDDESESDEDFRIVFSNLNEEISIGTAELVYRIEDSPYVGYSGPGGVGDAGTNKLWLTPGSINSGGSSLNSWDDVSGNSNNLSEGNGSTSTLPSYSANVLNGYGGVVFDGIDDRLVRSNFTDFPTDAVSALYVNQTTDSHDGVISYAVSGDASDANELLLLQSHRFRFFRGGESMQTELS